jgi:hypothetical protein
VEGREREDEGRKGREGEGRRFKERKRARRERCEGEKTKALVSKVVQNIFP